MALRHRRKNCCQSNSQIKEKRVWDRTVAISEKLLPILHKHKGGKGEVHSNLQDSVI